MVLAHEAGKLGEALVVTYWRITAPGASAHQISRYINPQTHRRVSQPEWVKEDGAVRSGAELEIRVRMGVVELEQRSSTVAIDHSSDSG
jgi:hypothetical protein